MDNTERDRQGDRQRNRERDRQRDREWQREGLTEGLTEGHSPRDTQASKGHSLTPNASCGYLSRPAAEGEVESAEGDRYLATLKAHSSAWLSARWALRTVGERGREGGTERDRRVAVRWV